MISIPVRILREIGGRRIREADHIQRVVAGIEDRGVQRIECIDSELQPASVANSDNTAERQIQRVVRATSQVIQTRFQTNAAGLRRRERSSIELPVRIAAAP